MSRKITVSVNVYFSPFCTIVYLSLWMGLFGGSGSCAANSTSKALAGWRLRLYCISCCDICMYVGDQTQGKLFWLIMFIPLLGNNAGWNGNMFCKIKDDVYMLFVWLFYSWHCSRSCTFDNDIQNMLRHALLTQHVQALICIVTLDSLCTLNRHADNNYI